MDTEFEKYERERNADPEYKRAQRDYFGRDRSKRTTRSATGIALNGQDSGCRWVRCPRND